MKLVQVQFAPWDKIYSFDANGLNLAIGDNVVVKTELGKELGKIIGIEESEAPKLEEKNENGESLEYKPVLRKADATDFESMVNPKEKKEALQFCKQMVDKHGLMMKLVDVSFSLDKTRMTFAFIADGRIDFRELVKDLTRHFNKTIRLYQIGIRDEAKLRGDYGPCGRKLCCKNFLRDLASITSEMAECQQVVHRGSERISGMCGRLMCCLAYENAGYQELAEKMPALETKVTVDGKRGIVVGRHILKQSVDVKFFAEKGGEEVVTEVSLNRHKKK